MTKRPINGTELFVETVGSGPPLLMLHGGLGLDHTSFRPYFDQLGDQATVVYYDHRGNGRSQRLANYETELTFDNLVADAIGVLDDAGIGQATLLGHSYGGFVAQLVAIAHPDRLSGLVLVDTVPAFDYEPALSGSDEQLATFGQVLSGAATDDESWKQMWATIWPLYFHTYNPDDAARIHAGTHYNADAWNRSAALLGAFNTLEQLPAMHVPTLAVAGQHDFITPPEPGATRLQALLPNAELAIFAHSGHYPFMEEEPTFFARLRAFLDTLN